MDYTVSLQLRLPGSPDPEVVAELVQLLLANPHSKASLRDYGAHVYALPPQAIVADPLGNPKGGR